MNEKTTSMAELIAGIIYFLAGVIAVILAVAPKTVDITYIPFVPTVLVGFVFAVVGAIVMVVGIRGLDRTLA